MFDDDGSPPSGGGGSGGGGKQPSLIPIIIQLVLMGFGLVILGALVSGIVDALLDTTTSNVLIAIVFLLAGSVCTLTFLSSLGGRDCPETGDISVLRLPAVDIYARRHASNHCRHTQTEVEGQGQDQGQSEGGNSEVDTYNPGEGDFGPGPSYGPDPNPDPGTNDDFFSQYRRHGCQTPQSRPGNDVSWNSWNPRIESQRSQPQQQFNKWEWRSSSGEVWDSWGQKSNSVSSSTFQRQFGAQNQNQNQGPNSFAGHRMDFGRPETMPLRSTPNLTPNSTPRQNPWVKLSFQEPEARGDGVWRKLRQSETRFIQACNWK